MKKISLFISLAGLLLATACQKEKLQPLEANFECNLESALVGDEITFNDTSLRAVGTGHLKEANQPLQNCHNRW